MHTIACGLEPETAGRVIQAVDILWPGSVHGPVTAFQDALAGASVVSVGRRAKLLLFHLEGAGGAPLVMAAHLKMTGRFFFPEGGPTADSHARVVFRLDNCRELVFHDMRKFGYVRLFTPGQLQEWDFYKNLGPEPLELDAAGFLDRFRNRRGSIKALLLNQSVIAGIGNIYADESLFRAGIRPDAQANQVSEARLKRLYTAVQDVLQEAIAACGSSIRDYRDARGDAGAFQNSFRVYGRKGLSCPVCGRALHGVKVAGRSSCFCPLCQRT